MSKSDDEKWEDLCGAVQKLLTPHYDEDGVMDLSGASIVGIDSSGQLVKKGSFIAELERVRTALARARGEADG